VKVVGVSHLVDEIETGFVHVRTVLPYKSLASCTILCLPQGFELAVYAVNEGKPSAAKDVVKDEAKTKVAASTVRLGCQLYLQYVTAPVLVTIVGNWNATGKACVSTLILVVVASVYVTLLLD
jgi:hypothetical protein